MSKLIKTTIILLLVSIAGFMAANWRSDLPLEDLKIRYSNPNSKFIEVQGMPVHYRIEGIATDTLPIVLLHGTGASLHTWEGWVKELGAEHQLISLDLPAYGLTGPHPQRTYEIESYVAFLADFLQKIGVQKFVLAGNSLGGSIAWNYALAHPQQVAGLILVDAGGYPMQSKSVPLAFQMARLPVLNYFFQFITPRNVVKSSLENVYVQDNRITDSLVTRYFELALRPGNRTAFVDRMRSFSNKEGDAFSTNHLKIRQIQVPTLLLWGEADELIPTSVALEFQRDLPSDTLVILPELGHTPMEEDPVKTAAVVKAFWKQHFGQRQ